MRAAGEGTIYQRKDGRWVATVYDVSGRRRELYARSEREALERKRRAQADGLPAAGSLTVGRWLQTWLDSARVTPRTREGYQSKINRLMPLIGHRRLDKLTADDLDRAYKALRVDLSERSVLHCHRVLHTALSAAVKRGRIVRNPASLVDAPRPGRYRPSPFTAADARTLLHEAATRRNGARWWLALLLGLRNGEALGLWWDQVDFDRNTITVSHQLQRHARQGLVRVPTTKTRKDRTLPLPPELASLLARMDRVSPYVFTREDGQPISPEADRRDWIELLAASRIPFVRIYDCRHTTATLLMEYGVPARVVADILGHSTVNLTLNTYTHVADPMVADALGKLTAGIASSGDSSQRKRGRGVERIAETEKVARRA